MDKYELISDQMGIPAGTLFEVRGVSHVVISDSFILAHPEIFRPVRWVPKVGEAYWLYDGMGEPLCLTRGEYSSDSAYRICFRTREAAEAALKVLMEQPQ